MRFAFDDDQLALKESARRFLADHAGPERARAVMATELGHDRDVWRRIAEELGWAAMTIDEAHGGLGLGPIELTAVMEEAGAALLASPLLATVALAAPAIALAGDDAQRARHLGAIAEGRVTAALAFAEGASGALDASRIATTARRDGDGWLLDGVKTFVVDGHSADLLVVAARDEGTTGPDGVALFVIEDAGARPGLARRRLATVDETRRLARVELAGVHVPGEARLAGTDDAHAALTRAVDLARTALAAEQVGGAERCLAMAVDYAKVRVQFGKPIGSFQAIKHKCADMLLAVESARSAAYYAAWVAAQAEVPASEDPLPIAAAIAAAYASDAYFQAAAESIQIHGGIGFTWEHDAHLHFKRARAGSVLLGDASEARERIARHVLDRAAAG